MAAARWRGLPEKTRFPDNERDRLAERMSTAFRTLETVQRLLAELGGKYPVTMSLVPGGVTVAADAGMLLRVSLGLDQIESFLTEQAIEDALLLVERHPETRAMGWGGGNFLSTGLFAGGERRRKEMFPTSLLLDGRVHAGTLEFDESILHSFFRLALEGDARGRAILPAPDKPGGYSWIKAPRVLGTPAETGPVARLIVAHEAGTHGRAAGIAELVGEQVEVPLSQANTVAGRTIARMGELELIFRRAREVLAAVVPGEATRSSAEGAGEASGQASAALEGPAGAVRHNLGLENGKIAFFDIIGAGTWNGSPRDDRGVAGPLELALGHRSYSLDEPEDQRAVSRIVHSFALSACDAVH